MPGSQKFFSGDVNKTSKAKKRRARSGKGGGGGDGKKWESLPIPRAFFASLFTERLHHYVGAWKRLPNARTFNWSKIRPMQCERSLSKAQRTTIFHVIRNSCSYYSQFRVALRVVFNFVCSVCHFYR